MYCNPFTHFLIATTRPFSGLTNLDYKPGHDNHVYFQNLSISKDDVTLLNTYHPNEIFDKYIVQVAGKGFTIVDHPSKVYGFSNAHECIDRNSPLHLVLDIDLLTFRSAKKGRVKRSVISLVKKRYKKEKFQPIEDETALSKGASQVTAKYEWLEVGNIRKGFVNFQAWSLEGALDIIKLKEKPKQKIVDRMANAIYSYPLSKLSGEVINVKKMEDFSEAYPNFLSKESNTTLICSPMMTGKTKGLRKYLNFLAKSKVKLPCIIWILN
ncbi:hypothetical protein GLOIN_2v1843832 [Rhizophagus clarus]|uniref:Replication origin-binding protein domain-containing protein n=1 Tax=Rhizophagus clarus TaxID=94130 RepID=A0A8H3L0R2_9GLOM|nr:hypothetical protein GLOIN_2v1843832 [Rhizophagus clarus]